MLCSRGVLSPKNSKEFLPIEQKNVQQFLPKYYDTLSTHWVKIVDKSIFLGLYYKFCGTRSQKIHLIHIWKVLRSSSFWYTKFL